MTKPIATIVFVVAACAAVAGTTRPAEARDLDYERLAESLDQLVSDPDLGHLAPVQLERARAALQQLKDGGRHDHDHLAYIAERRIEIARVTAEAVRMEDQRADLQHENDRLQLAAARRDAEQARRELERERLQAQIRAEEAERLAREAEAARAEGEEAAAAAEAARAEAAQSKRIADAQAKAAALAKKEAELASAVAADRTAGSKSAPARMSLAESAFVKDKADLSRSGSARIAKVVDFVNRDRAKSIRIEAGAGANHALARQRAAAVRDALVAGGVDAGRIHAGAAAGSRSHEVEISLEGG